MLDFPIRWIDSNTSDTLQALSILPPGPFNLALDVSGVSYDGQTLAPSVTSVVILVSMQSACVTSSMRCVSCVFVCVCLCICVCVCAWVSVAVCLCVVTE